MAKNKKSKFDFGKIKTYLIEKGERIALGVAVALLAWLILSSLSTAMFSQQVFPKIEKATVQVQSSLATNHPSGKEAEVEKPRPPRWGLLPTFERFANLAWFDPGAGGESKLTNPFVLPIPEFVRVKKTNKRVSNFQTKVIQAPLFRYQTDIAQQKVYVLAANSKDADLTNAPLLRDVESRQMVVVMATFPYKQQLDLIRKALRLPNISALLADKENKPEWLGLDVVRFELDDNGQQIPSSELSLYKIEKDKSVQVARHVRELLRTVVYDERTVGQLGSLLQVGLATPFPDLALEDYPNADLPNIDVKKMPPRANPFGGPAGNGGEGLPPGPGPGTGDGNGGGGFPGGGFPGGAGQGQPTTGNIIRDLELTKLEKKSEKLAKRLRGEFNPFDPFGTKVAPTSSMYSGPGTGGPAPPGGAGGNGGEKPGEGDLNPPGGGGYTPGPGNPTTTVSASTEHIVVRFFDVDLEPGKRYVYWVRPRLANPNFGKFKKVMFKSLADNKVLPAPRWTRTPEVRVPAIADYYVVDQRRVNGQRTSSFDTVKTQVQIHRWVRQFRANDTNYQSGVWAILSRLDVHRGEYLGETRAIMPMPGWNKTQNQFELIKDDKVKRSFGNRSKLPAVPVNFLPGGTAPVVVDYKGGRLLAGKGDDTAVKMLIVTPDGKLLQRDSRTDSSLTQPRGLERQERYQTWLDRLLDLSGKKKKPGGNTPPGGKPPSGCQ